MKQKLARASSETNQMDKVYGGSLFPMEYSGERDFDDYLSLYEAMATTLSWTNEKKGSDRYGKLKGWAPTYVSGWPDKRFSSLVIRLRDRFSLKYDEMFYP